MLDHFPFTRRVSGASLAVLTRKLAASRKTIVLASLRSLQNARIEEASADALACPSQSFLKHSK